MSIERLAKTSVEKPWGVVGLPALFEDAGKQAPAIGEIWCDRPNNDRLPLLVKYLFTSERLSIQVHPGDIAARRCGYASGKEEAWLVLDAEADAVVGLGLRKRVTPDALRAAALDGSIEELLDWRPATAGDLFYLPAGTVHAIGSGLTLLEVQQNADITFRLYDYGRPRELHLDQAIAVASPAPYDNPMAPRCHSPGREILVEGRAFVLERWSGAMTGSLRASHDRPVWLVPVCGYGEAGTQELRSGGVLLAEGDAVLRLSKSAEMIVAYPGCMVHESLLERG